MPSFAALVRVLTKADLARQSGSSGLSGQAHVDLSMIIVASEVYQQTKNSSVMVISGATRQRAAAMMKNAPLLSMRVSTLRKVPGGRKKMLGGRCLGESCFDVAERSAGHAAACQSCEGGQ